VRICIGILSLHVFMNLPSASVKNDPLAYRADPCPY